MMKNILLISFIISASIVFGQTDNNKTIFTSALPGANAKIIFSVQGHSNNQIGEFKDELISYDGKVLRVAYDEANSEVTIVYNEHMNIDEFIAIFNKYDINYLKEQTEKVAPASTLSN